MDVTPLPMGVVTVSGLVTKLIKRSTTTPHQYGSDIDDSADNQPRALIKFSEGKHDDRGNNLLGKFHWVASDLCHVGLPD